MNHSTGIEVATAQMVASAKREADEYHGNQRWVLLSLYAEIHRRAAAEIEKLAQEARR